MQILVDFLGGEGSRNDLLTFYKVNFRSGPKIPKGKVRKLRGGGISKKSQENFHFFKFDGTPYIRLQG